METTETKQTMKFLMRDIIVDISWANISKKYFGKSRSWLSQKMNGFDGNKSETEFSEKDRQTLKDALLDLAQRIEACANKI